DHGHLGTGVLMGELAPIKFEMPGEVERPRSRGRSAANTVVPIDRARPDWLKVRLPMGPEYENLRRLMRSKSLHTVCEEAHCPNMAECWGAGTATFMILGDTCTRSCGFCAVKTGRAGIVDLDEPARVGAAVAQLALGRDDARHRRARDRRVDHRPVPPSVADASTDRALLDSRGVRGASRRGDDDGLPSCRVGTARPLVVSRGATRRPWVDRCTSAGSD